ncbi:MAG: nucleotide sugar dehydrogenase [Prolixibacteraceae bacterium]|nr:nucleotide sugar dehydrogenase [Prolixibacteraceae bacterium]
MDHKEQILLNIEQKKIHLGIIGLGYVGLPLAVTFAGEGVSVTGFDNSAERVWAVNSGSNYISDIDDELFSELVQSGKLNASDNFGGLNNCDAIIICVPTPLDRFKKPDTSYIENACSEIARYMKPGTFICLESTTYPTTTEDLILPLIENESGLKHGSEFWLAFSPERVDPGNKLYNTQNTPKIIGALTPDGLEIGEAVYGIAIENIHPVSSPRVAEMVKILENTYRLVNISMINEMALLCGKMDIDIWEVIEAAGTKPFGFQAFSPGPGIGGHCIPLDPFYLEYIAKKYNFDLSMIHTAGHIDMMMPHRMTIKINSALNRVKKPVNGSNILFLGVAYKPNINDARESPALKIIDEVEAKGGKVSYHDPFIPEVVTSNGLTLSSVELNESTLKKNDCVVITTNHDVFDPGFILKHSALIVDLRNLIKEKSEKVYKL